MKTQNIDIPIDKITNFCDRWNIIEFALFGSVLRDNFRPDSDIDCLITTSQDYYWTIEKLLVMEEELEKIFHRRVDLVDKETIQNSLNYLRRQAILTSAKVIYERS
jgi:predicted nucleotidyltransferase